MTNINSMEPIHCKATSLAEYKYYQENSIEPECLSPGHLTVFMSTFKNALLLSGREEAAAKFTVVVKSFEVQTLEFNGHDAVGAIVSSVFSCRHRGENYFDLSNFFFNNGSINEGLLEGYLRDWDEAADGEAPARSTNLEIPRIEGIRVPDHLPQHWEIDTPSVQPQPVC